MRIPNDDHAARPWRIHAITQDFRLEDVWALPTPGGPDDFPRLIAAFEKGSPEDGASPLGKLLWEIRWRLGALLGWDDPDKGLGGRVQTLRDRVPDDLRDTATAGRPAGRFTPIYATDDEWAAEIANETMHGVLHLAWVEDGHGGFRGDMAVYVKPNGLLGHAYMLAIRPFRHIIVYPPVLRQIGRQWAATDVAKVAPATA